MATQLQNLKPWAALALLRPVKLARLGASALAADRLRQAVSLLQQHFPQRLASTGDGLSGGARLDDWPVFLTVFLEAVETAGWFEVNWTSLTEAHRFMLAHQSDHKEADPGAALALFLTYIPVKMMGLSREKLYEMPPMELLRALLFADMDVVTTSLQVSLDFFDFNVWTEKDRLAAWDRLRRIETNPARQPEPVRFLPELARWACGNTGNPLLDQQFDPRQGRWFRWDLELEVIKSAWRRTRPVRDAYLRLMLWHSHNPANLIHLLKFVTGETDDTSKLNW